MLNLKDFSSSPIEMVNSFYKNRYLISAMAKREVIGRYRGSLIGIAWAFVNPLVMLLIYTFVFSVVFKARWGGAGNESKTEFAIILFVGLIVHNLFSECVNRAPTMIVSNVNYVKKVIFPLEIIPWIALCTTLFHSIISLAVLIIAQIIMTHNLPWTAVLFPFAIIPLIFTTMGISWFLSALGVYVRDIGQVTGLFTTVLLFLSPVFYSISILPLKYQFWLRLNPLTFIIEEGRKSLIFGQRPDIVMWLVMLMSSLMIAWIGFIFFQKSRRGFADVL